MPAPAETMKDRRLRELAQRRESDERLSPHDLDPNFLYDLLDNDIPLTRKDMLFQGKEQAVVLTREEMEQLIGTTDAQSFAYVMARPIDPEDPIAYIEPESIAPDDVFILYPEEVGN